MENWQLEANYVAAADIHESRFVKHGADENQCEEAGAGDKVLGVSNKGRYMGLESYEGVDGAVIAKTGEEVNVCEAGHVFVLSGGAITLGETVYAGANGKALGTGTAGDEAGVALQAASGANELIRIRLVMGFLE